MKKIVKILALVLVVSMIGCLLASCATTLSGKYTAELSARDIAGNIGIDESLLETLSSLGDVSISRSYEFAGSKVTETVKYELPIIGERSVTAEYLYKIEKNDDGEYRISFAKEEDGLDDTASFPFEKLDDGSIKIAGITYNKK